MIIIDITQDRTPFLSSRPKSQKLVLQVDDREVFSFIRCWKMILAETH